MAEEWAPQPPAVDTNQYQPGMISIIIPVYNYHYSLFHYTGNCIGSVREHTQLPYEIILVENGSPIKHKELKDYKADKVIINETNMGVAHAWNQGIRMSRGEYVCLLNNDTMVFDMWDEDMVNHLKEDLDLVMSTPMYGDAFARATEAGIRRKTAIESGESPLSDFRDFACVMCKKTLFEELGTFDEAFSLGYGEDIDFLKRMEQAGKKYASSKMVNIFHIINATGGSMKEIPELMTENRKLLADKWDLKVEKKCQVVGDAKKWDLRIDKEDQTIWGEDIANVITGKLDDVVVTSTADEPVSTLPLFRASMTGDRVYLVLGNEAHWITSPEVLEALSCDFGDIKEMSNEDFSKLIYGDKITLDNAAQYANR